MGVKNRLACLKPGLPETLLQPGCYYYSYYYYYDKDTPHQNCKPLYLQFFL